MKRLLPIGLLLFGMLASACARSTQRQPFLILENIGNAQTHLKANENEEAAQIFQVILLARPDHELVRDQLAQLPVNITPIFAPTRYGLNLSPSTPKRDVSKRLLLYPVNRILDILDIISINIGPQGGLYIDLHATQGLTAKAGGGGGAEIGWWQKRDLGVGASHVAGFGLGPGNAIGEGETRVGTKGSTNTSYKLVGTNEPLDGPFQRHHDFWGIGFRAIVLIVGAGFEIHPMEIGDAILGFGTYDFLNDDFGSTKGLRFTKDDRQAMDELLDSVTEEEFDKNREYLLAHPVRPDLSKLEGTAGTAPSDSPATPPPPTQP